MMPMPGTDCSRDRTRGTYSLQGHERNPDASFIARPADRDASTLLASILGNIAEIRSVIGAKVQWFVILALARIVTYTAPCAQREHPKNNSNEDERDG